jgi:hypothetical protein
VQQEDSLLNWCASNAAQRNGFDLHGIAMVAAKVTAATATAIVNRNRKKTVTVNRNRKP